MATTADNERYERMPEFLVANVAAMGFIAPTAIQMQALPALLEGHEVLACAPTGSGKTAAFSLPMLAKLRGPRKGGLRGLVVCPTRELAMQTYQHIKKLAAGRNFRVNVLTKATSLAESDRRQGSLAWHFLLSSAFAYSNTVTGPHSHTATQPHSLTCHG